MIDFGGSGSVNIDLDILEGNAAVFVSEAEAKGVAVGCDVSQQPAALIGDAVSGRGAADFLPVFLVTAVKENCLCLFGGERVLHLRGERDGVRAADGGLAVGESDTLYLRAGGNNTDFAFFGNDSVVVDRADRVEVFLSRGQIDVGVGGFLGFLDLGAVLIDEVAVNVGEALGLVPGDRHLVAGQLVHSEIRYIEIILDKFDGDVFQVFQVIVRVAVLKAERRKAAVCGEGVTGDRGEAAAEHNLLKLPFAEEGIAFDCFDSVCELNVFEVAALVAGTEADALDAFVENEALQSGAVLKGIAADGEIGAVDNGGFQSGAGVEGVAAESGKCGRKLNGFQRLAVAEGIGADGLQTLGKADGRESGVACEGVVSDAPEGGGEVGGCRCSRASCRR